jgi:hypothetical protein
VMLAFAGIGVGRGCFVCNQLAMIIDQGKE